MQKQKSTDLSTINKQTLKIIEYSIDLVQTYSLITLFVIRRIIKLIIQLKLIKVMQSSSKWPPNVLLSIKSSSPIINLSLTKYPVIREITLKMDLPVAERNYNLLWTDHPLTIRQIISEDNQTKINHIPEITHLTRKNRIAALLNYLRLHFPKEYTFYPQTWVLPYDHPRMMKKHTKGKIYIVKPQNGCQGQGIFLTPNPQKLQQQKNSIVQEYIPNPLLINSLKFDLRIYVLITSIQPLRVYLYDDGIARFATEPFQKPNQSNLTNNFAHLTNYAINKLNQNFIIDEDNQKGHKRLITSIFKNQEYKDLMQKISGIIIKTIIAALPVMQNGFSQCKRMDPNGFFQLLGFDVMLTDKHEPLLLEVNQNPSLNTDTPFDHKLKSQLVRNILDMVTGGYRCTPQDKLQTRVKLKDRHEWVTRGNFSKIYPCKQLEMTEYYDQFIAKSATLYRQRFGINLVKPVKKVKEVNQSQRTVWNEKPSHYTHTKMQKIYGGGTSQTRPFPKTSTHKKRLIFI